MNPFPCQAAVVVGVLHTHDDALGAEYMSVGVDVWTPTLDEYTSEQWFNANDLAGSAARYLPDHPDADKLFAVDFGPAGSGFCNEPTRASDWCFELNPNATLLPINWLLVGSRTYLVNDTKTGPAKNLAVPTRALTLAW